jgi:uncharacterized membrane protein
MTVDRWHRMMNGYDGTTYGGFWLMLLVGLLFMALVGVAAYVALRAVNTQPRSPGPAVEPPGPSPREILDLRLARGEISPEDYSAVRPLLDP